MYICDSRSEGAEEAAQSIDRRNQFSVIKPGLGCKDQKLTHSPLILVCYITGSVLGESLERVSGNDTGDREQEEHESEGRSQREETGEIEHGCVVVAVMVLVVLVMLVVEVVAVVW